MGQLLDALRATRVEETSSDGSVQVTVTGLNETFVKLPTARGDGTNADLLAEQVEATVISAWDKARHEQARIHDDFGLTPTDPSYAPPWMIDALEDVESIECSKKSPHGYIEVFASGDGDLVIDFIGNSAIRTDISNDELEYDLNQALTAIRQSLAQDIMRCYQRHRTV